MPNQKQRREAARRHLERQLKARQEREARRKRVTLITSIVGTLVLIGAIAAVVAGTSSSGSGKHKSKSSAASQPTSSTSPTSAGPPPCGNGGASFTQKQAKGAAVTFMGVTVKGAADLTGKPIVTSHAAKPATKLAVKDLVLGKGHAATTSSCVTVQYDGVLYSNGKEFDSSWKRGKTAEFPLGPGHVIDGFTQGIGGTTGIAPMKVGGRRIVIVPASLGYGATPPPGSGIPKNASLVFIVDLKGLRAAS